jgi:hypothetical protein
MMQDELLCLCTQHISYPRGSFSERQRHRSGRRGKRGGSKEEKECGKQNLLLLLLYILAGRSNHPERHRPSGCWYIVMSECMYTHEGEKNKKESVGGKKEDRIGSYSFFFLVEMRMVGISPEKSMNVKEYVLCFSSSPFLAIVILLFPDCSRLSPGLLCLSSLSDSKRKSDEENIAHFLLLLPLNSICCMCHKFSLLFWCFVNDSKGNIITVTESGLNFTDMHRSSVTVLRMLSSSLAERMTCHSCIVCAD